MHSQQQVLEHWNNDDVESMYDKNLLDAEVELIRKRIPPDEDPTVVDEAERWRRFGQHDHVRLYSKNGFLERVREAGFKVSEYGSAFFGEELFIRTGITSQSVLYVVEK